MKSIVKSIKKFFDYGVIMFGIAALVCNMLFPGMDESICDLGGLLCVIYLIRAVLLWSFKPAFDWHLANGNFLRKTFCLIILMPLLFTAVFGRFVTSPKELLYEGNLYGCNDKGLPCEIRREQESPNLFWSVYFHFVDPGNQHMTTSKEGRICSAVIAVMGIFLLNGLLVSSFIGWIDRRKEKWQKGDVRYRWIFKIWPHYVVIGGNDMAASVVKQIFDEIESAKSILKPFVLLQTSRDVERFRREIFSVLPVKHQKRVVVYYGNRNSENDIKDLCLCRAKVVYILGEETRTDDIESYHDTMNMECLKLMNSFLENSGPAFMKRDGKLECRVMFEYQTTFSVFQFYDIDNEVSKRIDFKPFNYYEMWAQKVFINKEINPAILRLASGKGAYLPLDGCDGIKKDDAGYVHLFVVGMSRMGVAMAIEAAHLCHFPNYGEESRIRTKITFIDKNACEEKEYFMGRFKELFSLSHWRYGCVKGGEGIEWETLHVPSGYDYIGGDFIDIEWEFINGGIETSAVQEYILTSANPMAKITVAICLPESGRSHAAALYLDKKIYESDSVLQVLVYNRYGESVVEAFRTDVPQYPYLNKLKPFGSPEKCMDTASLLQSETVGKAIGDRYDEIYDRYVKPAKEKAGQVDTEVKYKGKSKVAKFWSNIYNGNTMWTKLRSIGYKGGFLFPEQVELLSDVEHNRWNVEQLLMNFRPLTKDEKKDVEENRNDKELLKGKMAHLNICSNKCLLKMKNIDVAARAYDEGLTTLLPDIYSNLKNIE